MINSEGLAQITDVLTTLFDTATEFQVENERLRSVLAFYAEPKNWESPSTGFAAQYDPEPSPINASGNWKRAADALAQPSA